MSIEYRVTDADRRPMPRAYATEHRHLGYDDGERTRPFARFLRERVEPAADHVREAVRAGRRPAEDAYEIDDVARRLSDPAGDRMETGWRGRHAARSSWPVAPTCRE